MEPKHTPGPWKIGKNAGAVVADSAHANENDSKTGHGDSEYYGGLLICESIRTRNDAKLIAAAPEMFELIEHIHAHGPDCITGYMMERMEEIIKKITEL